MTYAIITLYNKSHQLLADRTWNDNKIPYANYRGYNFHSKVGDFSDKNFESEKLIAVKETLESNPDYDWVWFSPVDSMITNFSIRIEDRIDNDFHVIASSDVLGTNTDSLLIRNSDKGLHFIDSLLSKIKDSNKPIRGVVADDEFKDILKIVPQRRMNSFNYYLYEYETHRDQLNTDGNWQFGDWVINWPGVDVEYGQELVNHYSQFIIN